MSKFNLKLVAVALVSILVGWAIAGLIGNQSASLGGSTSDNWSVGGNLSVTGTSSFLDDLTINDSGATSTLNFLTTSCIEMVATNGSTTAFVATSSTSGLVRVTSCD